MDMLQYPLCLIGRHKRSGHKAHYEADDAAHSVCKGCGRPMVKRNGRWKIDETAE
ncbi:hypothetical protein FHR23_000724 [Stakelama sediminis]|uniref:Uncharacterized protein n=1 Tax=Stakelama sediminis TaxID=463200 RepID=A0A840YW89_9SPHN|nr:hypothetical protein [Stakelama sediminis]